MAPATAQDAAAPPRAASTHREDRDNQARSSTTVGTDYEAAFRVLRVSNWPSTTRNGMGLPAWQLDADARYRTLQRAPAPRRGEEAVGSPGPQVDLRFHAFPNPTLPRRRRFGPRLALKVSQRMAAMSWFCSRVLADPDACDVDLVHIHSPMFAGIARAARRRGIPTLLTVHGTDSLRLRESALLRRWLLPVDQILCVAEGFADELRVLCPDKEVRAVYNGVDTDAFHPGRAPRTGRARRIVTVGTLRWQKDHERLIEAFAGLAPEHPDWELVIHGEGGLHEDLERRVAELGLQGRVRLPGALEHQALGAALAESAVYCSSSVTEGLPKALLEGMASGCACVATDVGECAGVLGDAGLLVPPEDATALREALERLMRSEAAREALGAAAAARAMTYSWQAYRDRHFDLYSSLLT